MKQMILNEHYTPKQFSILLCAQIAGEAGDQPAACGVCGAAAAP